MKRLILTVILLRVLAGLSDASTIKPLLLQSPTLSRTAIVFVYGGDLWVVGRGGGMATRLTVGPGIETDPCFSPDGTQIAFTGEYDGNVDVYVMPATGGVPKRVTFHPGPDRVVGWTRDGKQVVFRSPRKSTSGFNRLFAVPVQGGLPTEIPLPMGEEASYSPTGTHLAYVPLRQPFRTWKRYRGGATTTVWIANLADSSIEKIPRDNSNDFAPMWVENEVYFLSDRNGPVSLFCFDTRSKQVSQMFPNDGLDIKSASAGPGAIVYEQFGSINLFDLKTRRPQRIDIDLSGDLAEVRPRLDKVARNISAARLSPTGARALFEAHGEIFTVPGEKGDVRNLTRTSGAAERDPAWSPDGKRIAYFSDESGEYALYLRSQDGLGDPERISLGNPPTFYYSPVWSPDSKKIAYTDKRLGIWFIDLEKKVATRVDTDFYDGPRRALEVAWSPDSRWIAYTKQLRNYLRVAMVYSLETNTQHQLTDGMSDVAFPVFDKDGKYLFFTASTDFGLTVGWRDMSSIGRPLTRSVYVAVLSKELPSPLEPESDEEKTDGGSPSEAQKQEVDKQADKQVAQRDQEKPKDQKPVTVRIDLENIGQRVLALPIPARNYIAVSAGKPGILFLLEIDPISGAGGATLHKFDLKTRKTEKVIEGLGDFKLSHNGEKMLFRQGTRWAISSTASPPKPGEGTLAVENMETWVDPRMEWKQMYREAWRIQRDFFYDPAHHGLDLKAAERRYEPYLENIASREDLNYLFAEMMGELTASHLAVGGGSTPEVKRVPGGLLGADYSIETGRYRFARVFNGENWNPQLRAPLTQPGVAVVAGEYLLAVNGRELRAQDNIYSFFEATAGKIVKLRVGADPTGAGSREVTVTPIPNENGLRNLAWIEDNRRKVDEMSGGRLAYVYLPDTAFNGYASFNRYYFSQIGKDGVVIDERFNGGGLTADYIIDYLRRPLLNYRTTRDGADFTTPLGAIFGPKVMLINEYAGSGGDALPWYFRKTGIGPLIGKTTWGGLVGGLGGWPLLMDGGVVAPPSVGFWNPTGSWDVENIGVPPDIEVDLDPKAVRLGRDPQLEKAVAVLLEELKKNPPPVHKKPPFPVYHKRPG
ncbi:MAG TPA: PDZ domain-containing protein, partial [Blastocatellia bacterium]|nr:PDZ domain-containing protein [Blastocatellia bacterium]